MRTLSQKLTGTPDRPRPRAAYALPTLFTAGNMFLGFLSITRSIQGALLDASGYHGPNTHFEVASLAIGWAVLLDGLDGRIARMTNTCSDFGREMDSLADCITFGLAPAVLAYTWGVQGSIAGADAFFRERLLPLTYFIPFLFLLCGAARLARFNIQKNPVPKNPGRPDRKYFVGLPIPAGAALVAAIVYATDGTPIQSWLRSVAWLLLLSLLSFLMVSTWRYQSFKDIQLLRPRSPYALFLLFSGLIMAVYGFTDVALLAMALAYVSSGIIVRIGGILKRRFRQQPPPAPEHQIG